jgi:hypothetical protein
MCRLKIFSSSRITAKLNKPKHHLQIVVVLLRIISSISALSPICRERGPGGLGDEILQKITRLRM